MNETADSDARWPRPAGEGRTPATPSRPYDAERDPTSSDGTPGPQDDTPPRDERRLDDTRHDAAPRDPEPAPQPRVIATDPALDRHERQGVTGGTWIALILGALILIMLLIFILQNNVAADFAYLGWSFNLPLGVAMLFAAIAGVLVAALFGSIRVIKLSRRVRRLEKEREAIKSALR